MRGKSSVRKVPAARGSTPSVRTPPDMLIDRAPTLLGGCPFLLTGWPLKYRIRWMEDAFQYEGDEKWKKVKVPDLPKKTA